MKHGTDSFYDVIHSPDDGGWYAELYDFSGYDVHSTDVMSTREEAVTKVEEWAKMNDYVCEENRR